MNDPALTLERPGEPTADSTNRDIVAIGASAGGIQVLLRLLESVPDDFDAAVLVAVHIGSRRSLLPRILDRAGPLAADFGKHGEPIRRGASTSRHRTNTCSSPMGISSYGAVRARTISAQLSIRSSDRPPRPMAIVWWGSCYRVRSATDRLGWQSSRRMAGLRSCRIRRMRW